MTILSDRDIRRYIVAEKVVTDYADLDGQLQPASFDVRLADGMLRPRSRTYAFFRALLLFLTFRGSWRALFTSWHVVDVAHVDNIHYQQIQGVYALRPGEFILASTQERLHVPDNLVVRVDGRSTYGRLGITVHVTAGFIDPGFDGTVTLEIYNCGSHTVRLIPGTRVAQLVFDKISSPAQRPYGAPGSNNKYQGQVGTTAPRLEIGDGDRRTARKMLDDENAPAGPGVP